MKKKRNLDSSKTRSKSRPISVSVSSGNKSIPFSRHLDVSSANLSVVRPISSLPSRVYALLVKSIHQLTKRLSNRHRRQRKLELLETQQLGEKRFVAIIRVGKQKFLIGGATTSISLLAEINAKSTTVIASRPLNQETA